LVTVTHSPWRGDFSSLAFAQSWAEAETAAQMKSAGKINLGFIKGDISHSDGKNQARKPEESAADA
jgi:hypothetical protein